MDATFLSGRTLSRLLLSGRTLSLFISPSLPLKLKTDRLESVLSPSDRLDERWGAGVEYHFQEI